jgi:hypothetical protein
MPDTRKIRVTVEGRFADGSQEAYLDLPLEWDKLDETDQFSYMEHMAGEHILEHINWSAVVVNSPTEEGSE